MIFIKLIIDFFTVGILSFGGAYAAIPLIKDVASHYDIITDELLMDFIAISESTPGPVAVNLATFVGTTVTGVPGAIVATLAEILPAFLIILIFTMCFSDMLKNKRVSYALSIIRPCIVGLIMAVGVSLYFKELVPNIIKYIDIKQQADFITHKIAVDAMPFDDSVYVVYYKEISQWGYVFKYIVISILILIFMCIYRRVFKKKLSAIKIIIIGALLGMGLGAFCDKLLEFYSKYL